jgi:hypothetical protein
MLDGTGEKASVGGAGTAATSRMAAEQQILMVADQASKILCLQPTRHTSKRFFSNLLFARNPERSNRYLLLMH